MSRFAVIDAAGRVLRHGYAVLASVPEQAQANEEAIVVPDDHPFDGDEHWWWDGALHPRPTMPVTVTGLNVVVPPHTAFVVEGPVRLLGQADETGLLEFVFNEPGLYTVHLDLFPFLATEVLLNAS